VSEVHDHIIVGSGCTGAMAAQTLAESGARVLMLDAGIRDDRYKNRFPGKDFIRIRKEEPRQHEFFLGLDFEGLPLQKIGTGAQLTPQRKFMMARTDEWLPVLSENFFPMESLAYGGLGNGWGLGCCVFSDEEMKEAGLDSGEMHRAYQVVSDRIGISGSYDDTKAYTCGTLQGIMDPVSLDRNGRELFMKYERGKAFLNKSGFFMGRPALALLTADRDGRRKYAYRDLDFYSDDEESAYRPSLTVNALKKRNNFRYEAGRLVHSFSEKDGETEVRVINMQTGQQELFRCRKLVLAAGVLSTARVVLRSFSAYDHPLPVLSNYYCYVPCIQPALMGVADEGMKFGYAQAALFHDEKDKSGIAMASLYSYRSLMMMRLVQQVPLEFGTAREFLRYLMPALMIAGIHFPERNGPGKRLTLKKDAASLSADVLSAEYLYSGEEKRDIAVREKKYLRALRKLGCWPIRRIDPGNGSSIHYAGTLPFSRKEKSFSLSPDGRLHGTRSVFIADGSGFSYLPAKGLTFSLMANAHNVALRVLKE